jgi:hypothetical protein
VAEQGREENVEESVELTELIPSFEKTKEGGRGK